MGFGENQQRLERDFFLCKWSELWYNIRNIEKNEGKAMKTMKRSRLVIAIVLAVMAATLAGIACYAGDYYHATGEAAAALVSDGNVTVTVDSNCLTFAPEKAEAGFIFYPGGKVEYLMRDLAQEGILCVVPHMPLNLAVLDMDAAADVFRNYEVEKWYIGGHSLGGAMAASYAAKHPEEFEGLVLLASYSTQDLKGTGLSVLSLYGSADGVLDLEKYEEYRTNLPEDAVETILDGGCHACFGSYGPQEGDGDHTLTREEQTTLTAAYILDIIRAG